MQKPPKTFRVTLVDPAKYNLNRDVKRANYYLRLYSDVLYSRQFLSLKPKHQMLFIYLLDDFNRQKVVTFTANLQHFCRIFAGKSAAIWRHFCHLELNNFIALQPEKDANYIGIEKEIDIERRKIKGENNPRLLFQATGGVSQEETERELDIAIKACNT